MTNSPNNLGQNLSPLRFNREGDSKLLTRTKLQKKVKVKLSKNETLEDKIKSIIEKSNEIYGDYGYTCVSTKEELKNYLSNVRDVLAIDTETTGLDVYKDKIVGMSFYDGESAIYVPINHLNYYDHQRLNNGQLTEAEVAECFDGFDKRIVMHNANFDLRVIKNNLGINLGCFWDTYIGARILDENNSASLKYWYSKFIDAEYNEVTFNELFAGGIFQLTPPHLCFGYAAHDAYMTYEVFKFQTKYLNRDQNRGLDKLFDVFSLEMSLLPIVIEMEDYGMAFDFEFAQELSIKYTKIRDSVLAEFNDMVETLYGDKIRHYNKTAKTPLEYPLNIASPLQLQTLLFDIAGYRPHKKFGKSTGVEHLKEINSDLTNIILAFRESEKLLTTYIDKLPLVISKDGRVHCDFLQMGTDTGRFSSRNPNMQNIPAKAREIRQMFTASDGHVLISSDYSSQEPRILAHMSGDEKMIQAFNEGKDLYSEVASLAFNKPYEECQESFGDEGKKRRHIAKQIVLGVTYGKGIPAIAADLQITREEAQAIYDKIMNAFPKLRSFMEESKYMAQNLGYVTSMLGRKRRLPNINLEPFEYYYVNTDTHLPTNIKTTYARRLERAFSKQQRETIIEEALTNGIEIRNNNGFISEAVRQCVNARIQGSAADQTKQALIIIGNDDILRNLGFKLLLVIHDEVIGECPIEHREECAKRLSELMIFAAKDLTVPSKCDTMVSRSWDGKAID